MTNKNKLIKPAKLNKGDTIGIISPSGSVKNDNYWDSTVKFFNKKGYNIKLAPHVKDKNTYLAGFDQDRLDDLIDFFKNDKIKAIICSRGGYGAYRVLNGIDYKIIEANPKIFVGYSDITALNLAFITKSNLITFHGPLAISDFGMDKINDYTVSNFFDVLEGKIQLPYPYQNPIRYECINAGLVEGELVGGNLSVLAGLIGTPYLPDLTGKILLLEDVCEPLYKIDRLLTQLKLAGVFEKISGLIFGEFTSVIQSENPDIAMLTPIDIIKDVLSSVNIPIGYGFAASHAEHKATLPLGVKYCFNSEYFELALIDEYLK